MLFEANLTGNFGDAHFLCCILSFFFNAENHHSAQDLCQQGGGWGKKNRIPTAPLSACGFLCTWAGTHICMYVYIYIYTYIYIGEKDPHPIWRLNCACSWHLRYWSDVCWRMLTFTHPNWRCNCAYSWHRRYWSDVCWRMLTHADIYTFQLKMQLRLFVTPQAPSSVTPFWTRNHSVCVHARIRVSTSCLILYIYNI
jgi:hypothetical protein